jgi:hypothetical protein
VLAYLTDVEGQWDKLASFAAGVDGVRLDDAGALHVDAGVTFVFGGDAIDRGPHGRRVVATLLDARERQPGRVVLLAGNRDLNKMRLARELRGAPPPKPVPDELRGAPPGVLLPWIMANTMGAHRAFEHRRAELVTEGRDASDEAVAQSYLDDLAPDGPLSRYLAACELAWFDGATLIVHGAVTDENLRVVPGAADRASSVADWVAGLNGFIAAEVAAWRAELGAPVDPASERWGGRGVVAYQCPVPGTRLNQASVVYGRPTDDAGAPWLPSRAVVDALRRDGVRRLLVGHTPAGDAPATLRDEGFSFVMADNSYGRQELGSRVTVTDRVVVRGETVLDGGARVGVASEGGDALVGLRDTATGHLVKARLDTDDYLLFRALPDNAVEQTAVSPRALRERPLAPPYRAEPEGR